MSQISYCAADIAAQCAVPSSDARLIVGSDIRFSELIAALSVALDITQGNLEGHCMRTALVGMRLADELRLPAEDRSALFYALLLKDLGCSSNAAKITYLFGADDHRVKRSIRMVDWTRASDNVKNCWRQCAPEGSVVDKLLRMAAMVRSGVEGAKKLSKVRCERGADIARMLCLPEATARAILDLDEHWDGQGHPCGLHGAETSLLGRICCLAQTVEVFYTTYGLASAIEVATLRRGQWFDPQLVDALLTFRREDSFWARLRSDDLPAELNRWEPQDAAMLADEASLDRVAEAFANVVDAKSPWTYRHSTRVAEITVGVARQFGCPADFERDLRRVALLHDIGKLGVSNLILDKPGRPTDDELTQIRKHPDYSQQILEKVAAFKLLADVAGAHHERLDGRGYHRQLEGDMLSWATRALTVADVCEALTAQRPYREAMPWERARGIMSEQVGSGFDPDCLAALERWYEGSQMQSRVDEQLQEVDRLLAEL